PTLSLPDALPISRARPEAECRRSPTAHGHRTRPPCPDLRCRSRHAARPRTHRPVHSGPRVLPGVGPHATRRAAGLTEGTRTWGDLPDHGRGPPAAPVRVRPRWPRAPDPRWAHPGRRGNADA